jgi:hypothetical protein
MGANRWADEVALLMVRRSTRGRQGSGPSGADRRDLHRWRLAGATAQGSAHERKGLPNQDAYLVFPRGREAVGEAVIVVADGHGGAASFRSDRGSRMAVEVGMSLAKGFLTSYWGRSVEDVESSLRRLFTPRLVDEWRERVYQDIRDDPFSEAQANPFLPYGSTLLMAVIGPEWIGLVQLGDGDIVTVSPDGRSGSPMVQDPRLVASETTSLCLDSAVEDTRITVIDLAAVPPLALLLSTDGYGDSFQTERGFLAVGPDILHRAATIGFDGVSDQLAEWLQQSAQTGGDDTTLAVALRTTSEGDPLTTFAYDGGDPSEVAVAYPPSRDPWSAPTLVDPRPPAGTAFDVAGRGRTQVMHPFVGAEGEAAHPGRRNRGWRTRVVRNQSSQWLAVGASLLVASAVAVVVFLVVWGTFGGSRKHSTCSRGGACVTTTSSSPVTVTSTQTKAKSRRP